MRSGVVLVSLAALACSPDPAAPEYDVLGMNYDTGEDEVSESESAAGPKAECVPPAEAIGIDVGGCWDMIHGYQWSPDGCQAIRGCSCEGEGCAELYPTQTECNAAYRDCDRCLACRDDQACVVVCGHLQDDFYVVCSDLCEACSICPPGTWPVGAGCEVSEPISELPYSVCQGG